MTATGHTVALFEDSRECFMMYTLVNNYHHGFCVGLTVTKLLFVFCVQFVSNVYVQ